MLSKKQLQDVCMYYSNDHQKCKYLGEEDDGKCYCLKKSSKKTEIDTQTDDYLEDAKKNKVDPYKSGVPLGDNCQGYPILKHIQQGYDCP